MQKFNRRQFLKASLVTSASAALLPVLGADVPPSPASGSVSGAKVRGANEDIRVAVVGFGGRGKDHIKGLREVQGVRLVALCDVDHDILDKEVKTCENSGLKVDAYTDIRKLLDNKDIDAISIATPNHWHSLCAIWAVQAGKDVYVEKPVSHNVWEGRQLVTAARKYQRIVQTGTQSRSSSGLQEAIQWVRAGNIGKILRVHGLCYKRRPSIGKVDGPQPVPASVDYELWCGPAPKSPLMRKKLHYDWHWVWPTGNGDLGNQGIHEMDVSRWILGEGALSPRVLSVGGRLGYSDDGETPNTLIVFHDYPTAPLIFKVRGLPAAANSEKMDEYQGASIGIVTDCEGGRMVIASYNAARVFDKEGKELKKFSGSSSHYANFIKAVRSRKPEDLNADILEGHLSSALCHTGNVSYRLGKTHSPDEINEASKAMPELAEALGRMEEHLKANNVDLKQTPATLGALLQFDPRNEHILGNREANQLLTREYRAPFVVPQRV
jgi:predicted dehydrogenase